MNLDFFGFGASADLSTPLGIQVKAATDSFLVSPDWAKNMEICDSIGNSYTNAEQTVKALMRRLQDSDPKVVQLTLVLAETCMKNVGNQFAAAVNAPFMDEMAAVGRGRSDAHNAEDALRLIQHWGRQFESKKAKFPIFFETFIRLRATNLRFPPEEPLSPPPPADVPPKRTASAEPARRPSNPKPSVGNQQPSQKLQKDLITVFDKVRLCQEMLLESPGIAVDEALYEVVGFLEACRDRLIDVIEAGSQGLLDEELFALCLRVNDSLLRTLAAEKNGEKIPVEDLNIAGAPSPSAPASSSSGAVATDNLIDLGSPSSSAPKPKAATTMTISEDDEFGSLAMNHAKPAVKPIKKLAPPPSAGPNRPVHANHQQQANLLDVSTVSSLPPATASGSASTAAPTPAKAGWDTDLLAPMPAAPAPQTQQSQAAPTWDNIYPAPVAAATAAAAAPSPAPAPASAADVDALFDFGSTSAPAPAPAAALGGGTTTTTANTQIMTDSDFDAFLSGLKS